MALLNIESYCPHQLVIVVQGVILLYLGSGRKLLAISLRCRFREQDRRLQRCRWKLCRGMRSQSPLTEKCLIQPIDFDWSWRCEGISKQAEDDIVLNQIQSINCLATSPADPQIIVSASKDITVRVWSLKAEHRAQPCMYVMGGDSHQAEVLTTVRLLKSIHIPRN